MTYQYKYKKTSNLNKRISDLYWAKQRASRKVSSRKYYLNRKKNKIKKFVFAVSLVLFLIIVGYVLFFTSIFRIKSAEVTVFRNQTPLFSKNEIKGLIYSLMNKKYLHFFPCSNLLVFDAELLTDLLKEDSRVADLIVDKKFFPAKLEIEIKESEPKARLFFQGADENYYLSSRGQIIVSPNKIAPYENVTPSTENDFVLIKEHQIYPSLEVSGDDHLGNFTTQEQNTYSLPLIYDMTSVNLNDPVSIELFKNILDFIESDVLSNNNITVNPVRIDEQGGIFNVKMITSEGWYILISSEVKFEKQLDGLASIMKGKLLNTKGEVLDRTRIEYIDLRFGEKIFYF